MSSNKKNDATSDPIEVALENLQKQISGTAKGKIIKKASDREFLDKKEVIPFGIEEIDKASFCGGIPLGKMVELYGPESSGKSYLSLKLIASAQKMGLKCCLLDVESSFDPLWASTHGVDIDELYIINEQLDGETTLNYMDGIIKTGKFGLVVLDSTAALIPSEEKNKQIGQNSMALLARLMSTACKKIMGSGAEHKTTTVFINQVREKPGVMFGNPETTPGGRALKFYAHIRISVYPGGYEKEETFVDGEKQEIIVAKRSSVTFVKNKVARPNGKATMLITFEKDANNPLVYLAKFSKEAGLVRVFNGEFTINKKLIDGAKKNVLTGARNFSDLVHYFKKHNLIDTILTELMTLHQDGAIKLNSEIIKISEDMEYLDSIELPKITEEYANVLLSNEPPVNIQEEYVSED